MDDDDVFFLLITGDTTQEQTPAPPALDAQDPMYDSDGGSRQQQPASAGSK
ncbi:hypothetical protein ACSSS7_005453 [Eimeria intestinalis]